MTVWSLLPFLLATDAKRRSVPASYTRRAVACLAGENTDIIQYIYTRSEIYMLSSLHEHRAQKEEVVVVVEHSHSRFKRE